MSVGLCDGVVLAPGADRAGLLVVRQPLGSNVPLKLGVVSKLSDLFGASRASSCVGNV